jgi:aspartate racemase
MAKHIGIVACSYEGAALCYRTICLAAQERMGKDAHPEITLHNHSLAAYMPAIDAGDWDAVAKLMLDSARKVADAGAEIAISPDNTIHQAFDRVAAESPIPWLHIARVVGAEARKRGFESLGVLGTRYLMEGPVYRDALEPSGMEVLVPGEEDRRRVNAVIFEELVVGDFTEQSRLYFNRVMERLKERGADAAVLGCTEIPLLVDPADAPLPTLDSTRLLARAAVEEALI